MSSLVRVNGADLPKHGLKNEDVKVDYLGTETAGGITTRSFEVVSDSPYDTIPSGGLTVRSIKGYVGHSATVYLVAPIEQQNVMPTLIYPGTISEQPEGLTEREFEDLTIVSAAAVAMEAQQAVAWA